MQKDVIYIDVEDDITAIIGKVKAADKTVVALVPPKRIGVLQSAVNLRLLARAAKQHKKHLALVTSNQSLVNLAATASIPVAKNLQSKPELVKPEEADEDQEDIIHGSEISVGEHAGRLEKKDMAAVAMADVLDKANPEESPISGAGTQKKAKSAVKIPNFNTFRKRLFLGILAGIFLVLFLVWAVVFAPRATVVISAKTTSSSINTPVTVASNLKTSYEGAKIKAAQETDSEDKSVSFAPTGKKDVGKKASGTVNFTKKTPGDATIQAGTELETDGGLTFILDSSVTVPGATLSFSCQPNNLCPGEASGSVTAAENGSKYNAASGSLDGTPSSVSASFDGPTSGGVTKMVKIVTAGDVQKAKQQLVEENTDTIREDLVAKFGDNAIAIPESFTIGYRNVDSEPAVGEEADSAKLSATITYTVYGVEKAELDTFLDAYLKKELKGTEDQRVYENGSKEVVFQDASKRKNGATATLVATAQVGPNIKDAEVKNEVKGKRYGEIQETLESVQGVENVDVKFFPFWVSTVPNESEKITVEFNVDESK